MSGVLYARPIEANDGGERPERITPGANEKGKL